VRGCTGLCVAVVDSCPAPAACPLLQSRGCAWTGLCCRRPLRLRPLRPRRRRGALATTPTALPTTARRDQVGGGRREVGGGGTGVRQIPTSFLRPICAPASGPPGVSRALPRLFPPRARDSLPLPARVPDASLLTSNAFSTA